jgi:Mn-dependent DtxR family transcriptional regulator
LEHGVEGKTQKEIAAHFKWSAGTISRYTRHMEELGLLRIERRRRTEGKYKGTSLPNSYYFTFVDKKTVRPGGEAIKHPITTSIVLGRNDGR